MVSAQARRNYINALMAKQPSRAKWPTLGEITQATRQTAPAQPQYTGPTVGEPAQLNAADDSMAQWMESATSDTNPIGKILGPLLESNITQTILKALGTTGAATAPIVIQAAGAVRNAGIDLAGGLENAGVIQKGSSLSEDLPVISNLLLGNLALPKSTDKKSTAPNLAKLPGEIGDNVYDLWNNESTRGPVRYGVSAVDELLGLSEEDVNNLSTPASWARAGAGFGLDIATDPLSYVTGAGALKAGRVASQTSKQAAKQGVRQLEAFNLRNPDSLVRQTIRNTESWRRSRNPEAHRTAGKPIKRGDYTSVSDLERISSLSKFDFDGGGTPGTPKGFEMLGGVSESGAPTLKKAVTETSKPVLELESPLAVALNKKTTLPRVIPFRWEAVDALLPASGAKVAQEGQGALGEALAAASRASGGALRPLTSQEAGAWRDWLAREVKAGRITSGQRTELMDARKSKRPFEDFVAIYDRITRGTNETLSPETPAIAESLPLSVKARQEALDAVNKPTISRLTEITAKADTDLAESLGTRVYDGIVEKHLKRELRILKDRFEGKDPSRSFRSGQGAVRSHAKKGEGHGEFLEAWNTGDGTIAFDRLRNELLSKKLFEHVAARYNIPRLGSGRLPIRTVRIKAVRELAKVAGAFDDAIKASGIQPSLGYGKHGLPIGFNEGFRILVDTDAEAMARMTLDGISGTGTKYSNAIGIPQSNIADAMEAMLSAQYQATKAGTSVPASELRRLVYSELVKNTRITGKGETRFTPSGFPLAFAGTNTFIDEKIARALRGMPGLGSGSLSTKISKLIDSYVDVFIKARDRLYEQMVDNAQRYGLERVMQTEKLTADAVKEVLKDIETGPVSDAVEAVSHPEKYVTDTPVGAQPQAVELAKKSVSDRIPDIVEPVEFEAISATDKMVTAQKNLDRAAARYKLSSFGKKQTREMAHYRDEAKITSRKKHEGVANEVAPLSLAKSIDELDASVSLGIEAGFIARLWGGVDRMGQWFNKNLNFYGGTGEMGRIMVRENDWIRRFHETTRHELNKVTKEYGEIIDEATGATVFDEAFMALRAGAVESITNPVVKEAAAKIEPLLNLIMDIRKSKSMTVGSMTLNNMALREAGTAASRLSEHFGNYKLLDGILGDPEKVLSFDERALFWTTDEFNLLDRLKTYREGKPQVRGLGTADFLDEALTAHLTVAKETAIAFEGVRALKAMGAYTEKPKTGFVRVGSLARNKRGFVTSYIPDSAYIRLEEWQQLRQVENFMVEMAKPGGKIRQLMQKTVFPVTDLWKSWKTIMRPGHHVGNELGDLSMAFMAGYMPGISSLKDAMAVLKYGGNWQWSKTAQWTPADAINSLAAKRFGFDDLLDVSKTVGGDRPIFTVKLKGGKEKTFNARDFYAMLQTESVLPLVSVREFLGDSMHMGAQVDQRVVNKLREKVTIPAFRDRGGLVRPYAVAIAEGRDHHIRIAHLMEFMKKEAKHYSNADELFKDAAAHVEKSHPTGKGMAPFEQRNMAHLFAFYSWMRKAIPLTIETTFLRPGRFLAIPKASYALAQANGIDPHSIGDPFPADQLFPAFLSDKALGPQFGMVGDYLGFSPRPFNLDVLDTFGGSSIQHSLEQGGIEGLRSVGPVEGVLSSLTPAIKTPLELLFGTRMDTGIPIRDKTGYLDQVIPGADILNSLAGKSLSQTALEPLNYAGSAITGQPYESDRTGGIIKDSKAQSEGNMKDINLRILNYLLNVQGTNMSQPNYINVAEIEQRNRLGGFNG